MWRQADGTWQGLVHGQPVGCYFLLRLGQRQGAVAHLVVQVILNLILLVEARLGVGGLGPKVGNVIGAAQFQGYKMIDFILP